MFYQLFERFYCQEPIIIIVSSFKYLKKFAKKKLGTYPVEGAYPLHLPELTPTPIASTTFVAGFKLPKTVGSPIDNEIIFFSGFGVKVMVSKIFRMGLKVFLDIIEPRTLFQVLFSVFWPKPPNFF